MKTPFFWYPTPHDRLAAFIGFLLAPLSCFFRAATWVRRLFCYAYHSHRPVVCVGNVVAGGAGKTPVALALSRILKTRKARPVFVTRGYGGTGALTCVDLLRHSVQDVGDEALLLAAEAPTWVCRNRVKALREAEMNGSVVIMDDGLQNPRVAPTASVLVVDGEVGLGNGRIIPAGPLREPFTEALKRVCAMIIVGRFDTQNLAAKATVPVFRAHLEPDIPQGFIKQGRFVAFSGIARPEKFFATARALGLDLVKTVPFPDHYVFSEADRDDLRLEAEVNGAYLLTTEKDAVRLPQAFRESVIVLPVKLVFDDAGAERALADLLLQDVSL
ncbi:MAG: tetraacyldisaccharide 4'-kinase [Alphaproteobacteria bacterium]|nr:tetraacyldisaccharide 4'-kinase [Alphaproteobacteria bacterium]